jgi:uncharacterized protein YcbX
MRIQEINIFPVKSLGGISLDEAVVEDRGLRYDRRWMLVDNANRFLTQREYPVMARIKIALDGDKFMAAIDDRSMGIPFSPNTGDFKSAKIWSSSVRSETYPDEINQWFSDALSTECRLVAMPEGSHRAVNPFYAIRRFKDEVSFADGYPFMILSQASLDDLNSRLEEPVPMNRFRPNFVVADSTSFDEDNWKLIRIGTTVFHVVKPSERCVLTTVDQARGEKTGKEPLRTLSIFRNVKGKILFGQNLIAENPGGVVKVGDEIEVLERAG